MIVSEPPVLGSRKEAADICGVPPDTYSKWINKFGYPGAMPGTKRYDLEAVREHRDMLRAAAKTHGVLSAQNRPATKAKKRPVTNEADEFFKSLGY